MYLSQIKIDNFRLLTNFTLTLNRNLNVIVGENNSGKTALIDAIRYTLTTNSSEWIRIQESDFRVGQTKFSIQLKFEEIAPRHAGAFVEHLTHEQLPDGAGRRSVLYLNLTAELTDQLSRGNRVIRTDLRSGLNADGPAIERDVRTYLSATYLKPLRDAEAELTATRGSRLSQVLMSAAKFREQANVDSLLAAVIEANRAILVNPGIQESRGKISDQLRQLNFSTSPCNPIIEILGGTDTTKLTDPRRKQIFRGVLEKLELLIDENDRHQGLGYNNLLFMATELLLLEQERDDFPLLLIEEPEAHLHPQLQMKFLKALREDFGASGTPALQSILSTHSPNLASKAPLDSVIMMAEGKAFPLRPSETALHKDDYVFLEKFLDVTKSNLFFCRGVFIVEGEAESILLPTIAELLGSPLEHYGVSIVNVGSTAFARYAHIFQRKGLNEAKHSSEWIPIKVVCLRDLDLWPDRAECQGDDDSIGFKKRLPRNHSNWLCNHDAKSLEAHMTDLKEISGQNVRVEIADAWTFEYSLALKGLAKEIYEAVNGSTEGFDGLPINEEHRAIQIYNRVATKSGGKTETAYRLCQILKRDYSAAIEPPPTAETDDDRSARLQRNEAAKISKHTALRQKLPKYILDALDHMTGTTSFATNATSMAA
jgi:putative ATP-dependent endonuclease of OLD family